MLSLRLSLQRSRLLRRHFSSVYSSLAPYQSSGQRVISIDVHETHAKGADLLIIPFSKPGDKVEGAKSSLIDSIPSSLESELRQVVVDILNEKTFTASEDEKYIVRLPAASPSGYKHVALVGCCDQELDIESVFGKCIPQLAKQTKSRHVGVILPPTVTTESTTRVFSNALEGAYNDKRFKKPTPDNTDDDSGLATISVVGVQSSVKDELQAKAKTAMSIANGVTFARDLVGAPANSKTPLEISKLARQLADEFPSLSCTVLGQEECEAKGMGGFLAVQQGSMFPPQFVHMVYRCPNQKKDAKVTRVALVGKGLTFDSGGYNLKVGAAATIEMMKVDMGGLGAVIGCARAIAELEPENLEVHFISAVCENMISAEAMRPGDIVRASNGKMIEIINTDAEGRLTLADALVFADSLKPDAIVDLATLTGACVVALGQEVSALYCNDIEMRQALEHAGEVSGDNLWPLPLRASYKKNIKSKIADIKNVGAGGAGSITAALFLKEFVTTNKWAHIDMAGPVWNDGEHKPTGYGVKLLTNYLLKLANADSVEA